MAHVLTSLLSPLLLTFRVLINCLLKILHVVSHRCKQTQKEVKTIKDIPGPWPVLPILGTRWVFSAVVGRYSLNKAHEAYHDMFERYGDIIKEEAFGNYPVISTRSALDIEKVIKASSKNPLRPPDSIVELYRNSRPDRYNDGGLVNAQGEKWSILRKSTSELMNTHTMNSFLPELNVVSDDMINLIEETKHHTTGLLDDFYQISQRLALESSCLLTLGQRLGFLDREISPTATKLRESMRDHFNACRDGFYGLFPFWKIFPTATYRKLVRAEEITYNLISDLVEPAIKLSEETCPVDSVKSVLMSVLKRPELDIRDKKTLIIDLISAGIHTIGSSLCMILYHVASHPEIQSRLYKELTTISAPGEPLTAKHLSSATYMRACVQESFRLLRTAPIIARIITCDLELSGYFAPAGTVVLSHMWEASLDDKNFVRAKEYIPERWMPEEAANLGLTTPISPFLVAPFGFTSKRICPGSKFSELESYLTLAKIIRRYEVSCVAPLNLCFEFLLTPSGDLPLNFRDR